MEKMWKYGATQSNVNRNAIQKEFLGINLFLLADIRN
jgi:hypothetical protein